MAYIAIPFIISICSVYIAFTIHTAAREITDALREVRNAIKDASKKGGS